VEQEFSLETSAKQESSSLVQNRYLVRYASSFFSHVNPFHHSIWPVHHARKERASDS